MPMIVSSNGPQNVGQIRTQFECGNLFLSPEEYQRENAWGMPQKQLLIDTVFRGLDIPKFYLWKINQQVLFDGYPEGNAKILYRKLLEKKRSENDDPNPYIFEVVDGQQRIRTILEYMGVKPPNEACYRGVWHEPFAALSDTPMANGRYYIQLNADQRIMFAEKPLTVMVLENATINEIRDMFLRLQNGTPLNAQQKRDAMGTSVGKAAKELAELSFFKISVAFDNSGGTHQLISSQMLQLELKEKIKSCSSRQLDKLYEHYKRTSFEPPVVSRARKVIGILGKIFPESNPHLNQSYALSLYWLLSRILLSYEIPEAQYSRIRRNFEELDIARIKAMDRDYSIPGDDLFEDLSLAMSRGHTGVDGISTRHDVIGRYLFENVNLQERPELDPNRNFTYEEKLILYHKTGGRCQLAHGGKECGREITFDDAVVDHVLSHSRGGRTELSNGRIAHKLCNISRSNRDDFDPETDCHYDNE